MNPRDYDHLHQIICALSLVKSRFILEIRFYKCSAGDKYGTALQNVSEKLEKQSQKSSVLFGDSKYL